MKLDEAKRLLRKTTVRDETMKFQKIVFGKAYDYYPNPVPAPAVYGGVAPDSPRSAYDESVADRATAFRPADESAPKARKSTGKRPATKAKRAARKAPPAGRRNSLAAIRSKG